MEYVLKMVNSQLYSILILGNSCKIYSRLIRQYYRSKPIHRKYPRDKLRFSLVYRSYFRQKCAFSPILVSDSFHRFVFLATVPDSGQWPRTHHWSLFWNELPLSCTFPPGHSLSLRPACTLPKENLPHIQHPGRSPPAYAPGERARISHPHPALLTV